VLVNFQERRSNVKTGKGSSLGKPKAAGKKDGNFTFRVPSQEQLDEQKAGSRGRIPGKKWYTMKLLDVVEEISRSSSNPMWTWEFVITSGSYAGRTFKMWTVLTDDAAWKVIEVLEALGVDCPPEEEIKLPRKEVIGVGCEGYVVDDAGQDGDGEFSKLNKIRPHPKGAGYKPGKGIAAAQEEEEEEEERPRGKRREEEEDEDERPAKRRRDEEEEEEQEEEERPAKRRREEEEEEQDEEERPRPRKRSYVEDEEEERPAKRGKAPVKLGKR
jgi:hypothetical protein